MKFIATILSFIILLLSTQSCSDIQSVDYQNQYEISSNHNHQNDSDDSCPVTCVCNCCGMSITYEPLRTYNLIDYSKISTELITNYQPIYRFNFHSNIWQPPQVIN